MLRKNLFKEQLLPGTFLFLAFFVLFLPFSAFPQQGSANFRATHRIATNDGSNLRLRSSPSTSGNVVTSLANGSLVQVLETGASFTDSDGNRGNWMRVVAQNGTTGWGFGAYLSPLAQNSNTTADFTVQDHGDGTVTITKYEGWDRDLKIPSTIGGKTVTAIRARAFKDCNLTSVIIPDSVKIIEDAGNYSDTTDGAFYGNQLTSVTIGNGVTSIEMGSFANNKLTSIVIPNSVTSIGYDAFANNKLTSVVIPNSVTSLGGFANNQLTSVVIPNSVTSIWNRAFQGNRLTSVVIPNSVTSIESYAFANNQLTSVTIPNSVTSIGGWVFEGNPLTAVTIGANANCIRTDSFGEFVYFSYVCNDRKAGTYRVNANWWASNNTKEAESFQYIETAYGLAIIGYRGNQKRLAIPDKLDGKPVKYIAGLHKKGLTGIRIPDSVTYIEGGAFYGNQLTSVVIPNSVTFIGNEAFANNQLTSVTIGNSVTYIGNAAFANNQLTNITIPNSVTYLSGFSGNQLTSVIIPNSVTYIGNAAFSNNKLTSVVIPNSVTYLSGFSGNQLTSVIIPNSVTSIGGGAFANNKLTSVVIPNSVTYLDGFANNQLTSVVIPNSVTSIGGGAFANNQLTSVAIGNVVINPRSEVFAENNNFDSFYFNNGKKAGIYTYANKQWTYKAR